jgi:hypothetical protein
MDCLGNDHVIPQQRCDVTVEAVFSVWSVQLLYTEIPMITKAIGVASGVSGGSARSARGLYK